MRECPHPIVYRSGVVDTTKGGSQVSDIRTSDGMFFKRAEDMVVGAWACIAHGCMAAWPVQGGMKVHMHSATSMRRGHSGKKYRWIFTVVEHTAHMGF